MRYIYKAKKGPGEIVEGTISAMSQDAAVSRLIEQGLVPIQVVEERKGPSGKTPRGGREASKAVRKIRPSGDSLYIFTKQLKVLLKSQVPILNSLYILEDQIADKKFKEVISGIIKSVREGANFSESLSKFPHCFPPLYIGIIKAGEASGKLDYSLEQMSAYLEQERQLLQKVKSSLAYPLVMITVGIATVIFLMTFVIPKLSVLFEDFIDKIPMVTKILLAVALFFSKYWLYLAIAFGGLVFTIFRNRESAWLRNAVYKMNSKIPVIKDIIYYQSLCRFARGLSILLSNGVALLDSIRIAMPLMESEKDRKELHNVYRHIISGAGLEESLRDHASFLPDLFIKMVAVGEASGRLDEILGELADSYSDDVETKTKIVTSLIEPLAILVVGIILGFIVIAVLLPIFEISFFIE